MSKGIMQKIFDIRVKEVSQKNSSEKVKKAVVQFAKGVEITLNGQKVDLGEYKSVFLKTRKEVEEGLDYAVENFGLAQEKADDQKNYLAEKNVSSVCEIYKKN